MAEAEREGVSVNVLFNFSYAIWQAPLQDLNYATSTPV